MCSLSRLKVTKELSLPFSLVFEVTVPLFFQKRLILPFYFILSLFFNPFLKLILLLIIICVSHF